MFTIKNLEFISETENSTLSDLSLVNQSIDQVCYGKKLEIAEHKDIVMISNVECSGPLRKNIATKHCNEILINKMTIQDCDTVDKVYIELLTTIASFCRTCNICTIRHLHLDTYVSSELNVEEIGEHFATAFKCKLFTLNFIHYAQ
jgi:hypothetical protein